MTQAKQTTNPFKPANPPREVPVLSGESQIESLVAEDSFRGVILDSIDEVASAITYFAQPRLNEKGKELVDKAGEDHGSLASALLLVDGAENSQGFTQKVVEVVVRELHSRGRFSHHFEYEAMGTPFFKETLEVKRAEGDAVRYVLELPCGHSEEIAKKFGKPQGVLSSNIRALLSVVDNHWFNVDLKKLYSKLPFDKKHLEGRAQYYYAQLGEGELPTDDLLGRLKVSYFVNDFEIDLGFKYNEVDGRGKYVNAKIDSWSPTPDNPYVRIRDGKIIGPAWNYSDCSGVEQPQIRFRFFHDRCSSVEADTKRIDTLRAARDDLLAKIKESIK